MIHNFLDDVVDHIVNALHHASEYKAWLNHILVGIHADHKMRGATVLFSLLLDRIESTESGIAGSREDHVSAFADLGQRQFLAFARIVPGTISYANIVFNHANVRIHGFCTFLVTFGETMNQTDVHTAEKADGAGL